MRGGSSVVSRGLAGWQCCDSSLNALLGVLSENHTTPAYTCILCEQNSEFMNLRAGCSSRIALDVSAMRLIRTRHIMLVVHLRFSKQLRASLYSCGI